MPQRGGRSQTSSSTPPRSGAATSRSSSPPRPPPTPPSSTTMTPSTGAAAPSMPTRAALVHHRACSLGARRPLLPHRPPFFGDSPPPLLRRPSWPVPHLRASGEKRRRDHERALRRLPRVYFVGRSAASAAGPRPRSLGRGESFGTGRPPVSFLVRSVTDFFSPRPPRRPGECCLADPQAGFLTRRCLADPLALASILDPEEHLQARGAQRCRFRSRASG